MTERTDTAAEKKLIFPDGEITICWWIIRNTKTQTNSEVDEKRFSEWSKL